MNVAAVVVHTPRDQDLARRSRRHQPRGQVHVVAERAIRAPRRPAVGANPQHAAGHADLQRLQELEFLRQVLQVDAASSARRASSSCETTAPKLAYR